jgi:hypothetical protein
MTVKHKRVNRIFLTQVVAAKKIKIIFSNPSKYLNNSKHNKFNMFQIFQY